jgi:hypothetical protein
LPRRASQPRCGLPSPARTARHRAPAFGRVRAPNSRSGGAPATDENRRAAHLRPVGVACLAPFVFNGFVN